MIRFSSLGSGSRGNAMIVESGASRVLLDCGFGPRAMQTRLARIGLTSTDVQAVFLTHEHSDHIGGAFAFALRHAIPVFMTRGCLAGAPMRRYERPEIRFIEGDGPISFGELEIHPFSVPHDAREPVQYVFSDGVRRLGVLTDTGHITPHVERMLSACDALVLECNHDSDMLANGRYPAFLKARVGGDYGHLANAAAAQLLRSIDCSRLRHVIAAHLSEQNNTPHLARLALSEALGCAVEWIAAATQAEGFDWRDL